MTTILIADTTKASLVMTSEVFKDKIQGSIVIVAKTGHEAIELARQHRPDMCVVDFDLPDTDGVTLVTALRESFEGPILMTAFPDDVVREAASTNLFGFSDASGWLSKPIKVEELNKKIEQFLLEKQRTGRRFASGVSLAAQLIGKGAGRGKRAPKVNGRIVNLSFGGACIEFDKPIAIKNIEELTIAVSLPETEAELEKAKAKFADAIAKMEKAAAVAAAKLAKTAKSKSKTKTKAKGKAKPKAKVLVAPAVPKPNLVLTNEAARIKARIAWTKKGGHIAGLQFNKLTPQQKKGLEILLKDIATTETVS